MELKENSRVKIKYRPELGVGEIIRIQEKEAEYLVDVVFEKEGKRVLETFPSRYIEPVPDIFDRFLKGESDPPIDFFLKQLSYQFPLENLGGKLSNSKTDLLPHQILLTHQVVNSQRRRLLIADEVGLGKTIEIGMIIRELLSRGDVRRVLIICPAGLIRNWQDELRDRFRLYFDVFGQDFADGTPQGWERHNLAIVSIDTIKKPQRLEKLMMVPDWDLIVFDEAHHLSRKRYGKKIELTQNYRLAERLRSKTRDLLFLTATPHQGDPYQFWSLIQLLDDHLFESPESLLEHRGLLNRVMIRRTKREVTDAEGRPIFMRRQVHTQKFQLSVREQRFYDKLTEYLKEGYDAAGYGKEQRSSQQRAVGFVMATFQKIMSSSPRAIKQALRRRLIALYARRQMALEEGLHQGLSKAEVASKILDYQEKMRRIVTDLLAHYKRPIDYIEADAYIASLKQGLKKRPKFEDEVTHWALDVMETEEEVIEAEANIPNEEEKVRELIELIDDRPDRKFDTLIRAIEQIRRENKEEKMVIFTQYLETLYFLAEELGKYYPLEKIAILKGGPLEDKIAACESFWEEDGAQFLISTTAGGEGINLQVCRILFNYDLPWNPMAIEQRIGRIHRYGQTETAQVYNLVAEGTIEEKVYTILEEKLLEIARTIGKIDEVTGQVVEDFRSEILGFLGSSTNYNDLYREALVNRDYKRTEKEIEEAILKAKEASEALRQLTQDLSAFNLDQYKEIEGKFNLEDLRIFTEKAILRLGGSFIPSGEIIQIIVPPSLRKYPNVAARYDNVTFSRKLATRKKNIDLLGIGHPLINAVIEHFKGEDISGEILNAKCEGIPPSLTARYVFTLEFEDGTCRQLYKFFVLKGNESIEDLTLLKKDYLGIEISSEIPIDIRDRLELLISVEEAKIRSNFEEIINIRKKCVGLQAINC